MEIDGKVIEVVSRHLNLNSNKVTKEAYIASDLGADSLDMTELIMTMEEEFNIKFSDEEAEKLITVQDLIDFVKKQRNIALKWL